MKKKLKIPPISAARKEIFEAHDEPQSSQNTLHASLYISDIALVKKRAASIPVPWVDPEVTGNEIIKDYYKRETERRHTMASMAWARSKWWDYFCETFRVSLGLCWDGNLYGLNVRKVDQYLKVPDGASTYDFVRGKHGEQAVTCLEELIRGIPEQCDPVKVVA